MGYLLVGSKVIFSNGIAIHGKDRQIYIILTFLMYFCGCEDADRGSIENAKIIAIGDSIFEWHIWNQHSVPEQLGRELGMSVYNNAISGSLITEETPTGIRNQYIEGDWEWVVMDGGEMISIYFVNVINAQETQDKVEAVYKEFLQQLLERENLKIIIWGYYGLPEKAKYGFDECHDDFEELRRRQNKIADTDKRIFFVDGSKEITGDDKSYFYIDKIHPSRNGTEVIGRQISEVIKSSNTD